MTTRRSGLASYSGVPVLVLGASGFIGRWVSSALVDAGATVCAVVRGSDDGGLRDEPANAYTPAAVHRVLAVDLERPGAATAAIDAARPAIVFNVAGYGVDPAERDRARMSATNDRLVQELCDRLARDPDRGWAGLRLVHAGSVLECGSATGPVDEQVVSEPLTEYGRLKLAGTRHVARAGADLGLHACVARLFSVYGPGEHPHRLLPSLRRVRAGEGIPLTRGDQRRDFTYVEDVAEGLLRLGIARVEPGAVVNLATGRLTSVREFAEAAADAIGLHRSALAFGDVPTRVDELRHGPVIVARLDAATSWRPPTSVAQGIRRSLQHADD